MTSDVKKAKRLAEKSHENNPASQEHVELIAEQAESPKFTAIQYLEINLNQYLKDHSTELSMHEIIGLFTLKIVELKETWRIQTEQRMRETMQQMAAAKANGNAH